MIAIPLLNEDPPEYFIVGASPTRCTGVIRFCSEWDAPKEQVEKPKPQKYRGPQRSKNARKIW